MKRLIIILMVFVMAGCSGSVRITPEAFGELKKGMTIEEVKEIVGGKPSQVSEIEGTDLVEYEYTGIDGIADDSYVSLFFKGDKLDLIIESGLTTEREVYEDGEENEIDEEDEESERISEIENVVNERITEKYSDTSINELTINQDIGKGEGYIVLTNLSFNRLNKAKTAKEMIEMYSQDLGAHLASQDDVNEVVVFWEVPYLLEGSNIAKMSMHRSGVSIVIEDEWYDPQIFE